MSILFVGGELADFTIVGGTPTQTTVSSYYSTNYARSAVQLGSGAVHRIAAFFDEASEVYVKWLHAAGNDFSNSVVGADVFVMPEAVRILGVSGGGLGMVQRWDGAEWIDINTVTVAAASLSFLRMHVKIAVNGVVSLAINDETVAEYLGDTTGMTPSSSARWRNSSTAASGSIRISEVIIATHDISAARLKTLAITDNGTDQEWTSGAYTDIDAYNEADTSFIASDTVDQSDTYVVGDLADDSLEVSAVVVAGRFRRNSTGPTGIDALVRVDGVNYGQDVGELSEAFESKQVIWAVDPSTSAPWTREAVGALEIGVKSTDA